jgi:7-cyano-7-deazaguanine synthase
VPIGGVHARHPPSPTFPARNTIMLSLALAWAEVLGQAATSSSASMRSTIPVTRIAARNIIAAFETMANLATKAGVEGVKLTVHAPLIDLSKAEIIRLRQPVGRRFQPHGLVLSGR